MLSVDQLNSPLACRILLRLFFRSLIDFVTYLLWLSYLLECRYVPLDKCGDRPLWQRERWPNDKHVTGSSASAQQTTKPRAADRHYGSFKIKVKEQT
jgi:hypothetical protein